MAVIYLHPLHIDDQPLWCPDCRLPSAITVLYGLTDHDQPIGVRWFTVCVDCGMHHAGQPDRR